jgi:hypothetical protein
MCVKMGITTLVKCSYHMHQEILLPGLSAPDVLENHYLLL